MASKIESNSSVLRRCAKELMQDGREKSVREITEYAEQQSGRKFTQGMISGALWDLVNQEPVYRRSGRGMYVCDVLGIYVDAKEDSDEFDKAIWDAIRKVTEACAVRDITQVSLEDIARKQAKATYLLGELAKLLDYSEEGENANEVLTGGGVG